MALSSSADNAEIGPPTDTSLEGSSNRLTPLDGMPDMDMVSAVSNISESRLRDAELERLRQEVLTLIAPYEGKPEEPPFSIPELVVISAVCWDPKDQFAILSGILKNFPFYGHKAVDQYILSQHAEYDEDSVRPKKVIPGFDDAFKLYDLPFADADERCAILQFRRHVFPQKIRVRPRAARIFLWNLLEPKRKGFFPFLDLPAELRNTVYEMLFTFPAEGIAVARHNDSGLPGLLVLRRREDTFTPDRLESCDFGNDQEGLEIDAQALSFSLLRVNRQIHAEAAPLFYGLNHLCCIDSEATNAFLYKMNHNKLKFVRDVRLCVNWCFRDRDEAEELASIMQTFASTASLRRLEIETSDTDWLGMRKSERQLLGREKQIKTFDQVPGFDSLAKLCSKAQTLVFIGERGLGFEKWMTAQVDKIKKQAGAASREETTEKETKRKTRGARNKKKRDSSSTGKKSKRV